MNTCQYLQGAVITVRFELSASFLCWRLDNSTLLDHRAHGKTISLSVTNSRITEGTCWELLNQSSLQMLMAHTNVKDKKNFLVTEFAS